MCLVARAASVSLVREGGDIISLHWVSLLRPAAALSTTPARLSPVVSLCAVALVSRGLFVDSWQSEWYSQRSTALEPDSRAVRQKVFSYSTTVQPALVLHTCMYSLLVFAVLVLRRRADLGSPLIFHRCPLSARNASAGLAAQTSVSVFDVPPIPARRTHFD